MHGAGHSHGRFHGAKAALKTRAELLESVEIPNVTLENIANPKRSSGGSKSEFSQAQYSCTPGDNSPICQLPQSSQTTLTLPVVLGVVIPVVGALIAFLILHRRHVRKQRLEDANDKHASLDFGLGEHRRPVGGAKIKRKQIGAPQMGEIPDPEGLLRRGRGMSMDMGSPYVLPEGRPSFHSFTPDEEDPYRPVTFVMNDAATIRSGRADSKLDTYSVGTRSSRSNSIGMKSTLLRNAQPPSVSSPASMASPTSALASPLPPPPPRPTPPQDSPPLLEPSAAVLRKPLVPAKDFEVPLPAGTKEPRVETHELPGAEITMPDPTLSRKSVAKGPNFSMPRNYDHSTAYAQDSPPGDGEKMVIPALPTFDATPSDQSMFDTPTHEIEEKILADSHYSSYTDVIDVAPKDAPLPELPSVAYEQDSPAENQQYLGVVDTLALENRRYSGVRPLPPDDITDNPEQRANRIRSFYREYFDENKPDPVGRYDDNEYYYDEYYEDYDQEYLYEGAVYDPLTGEFVYATAPHAQPMTRRAMTPPPRRAPRFHGAGRSNNSVGQFAPRPRGQRAFSTASARQALPGRGRPPRRNLPPPAPLSTLPTPHMLQGDPSTFSPIDFAPPLTYRQRQMGSRPASPLGEKRPYSPSVRAHTPLQSAFSELAPMPSPHALRRSGTFTALDFAPPPRFRGGDTASDSGSIRSNGSTMSPFHASNIRNGAYRISRLPKESVGTKMDLAESLRPTWQVR